MVARGARALSHAAAGANNNSTASRSMLHHRDFELMVQGD